MDLISEHFYCQRQARPGSATSRRSPTRSGARPRPTASTAARSRSLKGKDIRIALDEWNYWYGPHVYGELGTRYFLKDALGVAAGLNEFARQSDIFFMANYAQTVNVIGCIKTTKTAAVFDTTGVVLALYRKHFGTVPVAVMGTPEPLDVMACWLDDSREVLTLSIVNPTKRQMTLRLDAGKLRLPKTARFFLVGGLDPRACNVPGPAHAGRRARDGGRAVREDADGPADQRLAVPHRREITRQIGSAFVSGRFIFSAVQRISLLAPAPRKPSYTVSPTSGGPPFQHGGLGATPVAASR